MNCTLTFILAGGRGERLLPLTRSRAKPVVSVAGRRLIDYTLANCRASGLRDVVVLTQHLEETVQDYLAERWQEKMPGLRTLSSAQVGRHFRGTADAVRAALTRFGEGHSVLVLSADHVYDMNYRDLMTDHRAQRADATISVVPVPLQHACSLGCVTTDETGLVRRFVEKPPSPHAMPGHPRHALASRGVYLFRRRVLEEFLHEYPEADDFAHHVFPGLLLSGARVATHSFVGETGPRYWRDIGDIESYHAVHMDLLEGTLHADESWIGPHSRVADGSIRRCVLGRNVEIGPRAEISESVLLDGVVVEPGARVHRAVVEEGVRIPANARIGSERQTTIVTESALAEVSYPAAS